MVAVSVIQSKLYYIIVLHINLATFESKQRQQQEGGFPSTSTPTALLLVRLLLLCSIQLQLTERSSKNDDASAS